MHVRRDDSNYTPLLFAATVNLVEMAKLLLEHGADVDTKDDG